MRTLRSLKKMMPTKRNLKQSPKMASQKSMNAGAMAIITIMEAALAGTITSMTHAMIQMRRDVAADATDI